MAANKKYDTEFFKKLFISGEKSLRAISREYGISYTHISKLSSAEEWGKAKAEYIKQVTEAEQSAEIKRMDDDLRELASADPLKADEHQKRAIVTGDKLGTLIQTGIQAARSGDWKNLKLATETWRSWDEQMRKNHGIDEKKDKPLININVMAALPPKSQLKRAEVDA
jgi:hypothetical protein